MGSDSITIKTEIFGNTDEPMEDDDADADADAVCIVNLDESIRVIYMDHPFGTDDNYVYDGSDSGREGEELLEESGGGDTSSGEDGDGVHDDGPGDHGGNAEEREGGGDDHGENPSPATGEGRKEEMGVEPEMPQGLSLGSSGEDELPVAVERDPVAPVKYPDNMYQAVRSVMAGVQDPVKLNQRMKYGRGEDPGFLTPGDERILRNANMCNMEEKRISSASFDTVSGRCFTCLNGDHKAWISRSGGPICVVLSDQHFPANIPADSVGECFPDPEN